jgi:hypothetical protein
MIWSVHNGVDWRCFSMDSFLLPPLFPPLLSTASNSFLLSCQQLPLPPHLTDTAKLPTLCSVWQLLLLVQCDQRICNYKNTRQQACLFVKSGPLFHFCMMCAIGLQNRAIYISTLPPPWKVSLRPQSNQSAGPVCFLIFCSKSISLLASPVAGRKPQWTAGAD